MKLTKATIEQLKLPAGKSEAIVFDEGLPGFGLRTRAGGKRTWIVQYRLGSKQRRVTIGTVETLNADEARQAGAGHAVKSPPWDRPAIGKGRGASASGGDARKRH